MNNMQFVGNLGRDAEVRPAGQTSVCDFSVAVKTGFGKSESTAWVKCALFGKRAEGELPTYLTKGQQVAVSGEFSLQEWTNKDGEAMTTLACNVASLDLVGGRPDAAKPEKPPAPKPSNTDEVSDDFDDDIPF